MQLDHGTWVIVADGEKFVLLRNIGDRAFLNLEVVRHEAIRNPPAHELSSDRAGRRNDSTRDTPDGVGATAKSAMEETDWHRVAKERFAEDIAERLGRWAASGRFRHLVVIADPRTLGALRTACDDTVKSRILAEIDKDLTNLPLYKMEDSIRAISTA